jgi:hypothetical protein
MKKQIILIALMLISVNSFAQSKTFDEINREGCYPIRNVLKDQFSYDKSKATFRQTTKWIVEKMNLYTTYDYREASSIERINDKEWSNTFKISNSKVSIDSPYLIIEQDVYEENYFRDKYDMNPSDRLFGSTRKKSYHRKSIIPINNLMAVEFSTCPPYYLEFETFDESIIGSEPFQKNKCKFYMTFDKEDKIDDRLMKAFIHLNRFFWKKVGKETF